METTQGSIEAVTMTEILGLDTWNHERSSDQLQSFITRRHEAIQNLSDDE